MVPPFDENGNLPSGVYRATFDEIANRFGSGSEEREVDTVSEMLTPEAYAATKEKYANMQERLAALEKRTDLQPEHAAAVRKSYLDMMRHYLRDIKLYEAAMARRGEQGDPTNPKVQPKTGNPDV